MKTAKTVPILSKSLAILLYKTAQAQKAFCQSGELAQGIVSAVEEGSIFIDPRDIIEHLLKAYTEAGYFSENTTDQVYEYVCSCLNGENGCDSEYAFWNACFTTMGGF